MKRLDIVYEARSWLETPYHHQGRVKRAGVDCVGLIEGVGQAFDLPFVDRTGYDPLGRGPTKLFDEFVKWLDPIHPHLIGVGDIMIFYVRHVGECEHTGIRTPVGMLHTHAQAGKVVEHPMQEFWSKRLIQGFRFRGLED